MRIDVARKPLSLSIDEELTNAALEIRCARLEKRFDPFAHIAREQCTVGALRASVAGHDVSIHAMDQGRYAGAATMNLAELAAAATA